MKIKAFMDIKRAMEFMKSNNDSWIHAKEIAGKKLYSVTWRLADQDLTLRGRALEDAGCYCATVPELQVFDIVQGSDDCWVQYISDAEDDVKFRVYTFPDTKEYRDILADELKVLKDEKGFTTPYDDICRAYAEHGRDLGEVQKKSLFVSVPMKGLTDEQIYAEISTMHKIAEEMFGEELMVLKTFQPAPEDYDGNQSLYCLGRSIQLMAEADYYIGCEMVGTMNNIYNGCDLENQAAMKYLDDCNIRFINLYEYKCFEPAREKFPHYFNQLGKCRKRYFPGYRYEQEEE